jgi:cell division protein FtsZ
MVMPGLINLDFADVRTVMSEMGKAMMGTGEAEGERRAIEAAEAAISNPLLEDITMEGARGVLINITGGPDMTLFEVDEAANRIREEVDPEANILFGSTFEPEMEGKIRVSVVATGIDAAQMKSRPEPLRSPGSAAKPAAAAPAAPAPSRPTEAVTTAFEDEPMEEAPEPEAADVLAEEIEVDVVADADSAAVETPVAAPVVAPVAAPVAARPEPQPARIEPSIAFRRPEAAPPAPAPAAPSPASAAPARSDLSGRRVPFIPPKPMTPTGAAGKEDREPPIVAARPGEHVNDLGQPSRRRSLFERMTGVSRPREPGAERGPGVPREPIEPRLHGNAAPRAETAAQKATAENPPARAQQEHAPPKAAQPTSEEEVLDIPAFLRRQAN